MKVPEKVVWKGEKAKRDVLQPPFNQQFWTQTMAWVDTEGRLRTGVILFEDTNTPVQCYAGMSLQDDNPILQYREFLMLDALTRIGYAPNMLETLPSELRTVLDELEQQLNSKAHCDIVAFTKLCAAMGVHTWSEAVQSTKDVVLEILGREVGGADRVQQILRSVPPDLPWLLGLLKDFGAELDLGSITDAAERGELEFTAALEALGVESPRRRAEKKARREQVLSPLQPHIDAILALLAHERHEGCSVVDSIEAGALNTYIHGIDDVDLQLGIGLIVVRMRGTQESLIHDLAKGVLRMVVGEGGPPLVPNFDRIKSDAIEHAAGVLANQFTERKLWGRKGLYVKLLTEAMEQVQEGPVTRDDV